MANIFSGWIIYTFISQREKEEENEEDIENKCFICCFHRDEVIEKLLNFERHKKEHCIESYIEYII